jgi:hypothetical protein
MKQRFTTTQIIFIAAMVAFDFAFGMVVKTALAPTGILGVVRLDMAVPVMLMMLTRLLVDRFGTLMIYEGAWGLLSVLAMPGAFGLPGPLKLLPALAQGLVYDAVCSSMRRAGHVRLFVAAVTGGLAAMFVMVALKVALGMPWATVTKVLFGVQTVSAAGINLLGAAFAVTVWGRIRDLHAVKRLRAQTT